MQPSFPCPCKHLSDIDVIIYISNIKNTPEDKNHGSDIGRSIFYAIEHLASRERPAPWAWSERCGSVETAGR